MSVLSIYFTGLCSFIWIYQDELIELAVVGIDGLQPLIKSVLFVFLLNFIPDALRFVMIGVIKGLGLQTRILVIHMITQGPQVIALQILFVFVLDWGMIGIWLAKFLVEVTILACYIYILTTCDWE